MSDHCPECGSDFFDGHKSKCRTGVIRGILNTSVDDVWYGIAACKDISILQEAVETERGGSNRTTLIRMIERRIRKLTKESA